MPDPGLGPERVAELVEGISTWTGGDATCLERSAVLVRLLDHCGRPGELRIGVRRNAGDGLAFHAWVTLDGGVLNDDPDVVRDFLPFEPPAVPDPAATGRSGSIRWWTK